MPAVHSACPVCHCPHDSATASATREADVDSHLLALLRFSPWASDQTSRPREATSHPTHNVPFNLS